VRLVGYLKEVCF